MTVPSLTMKCGTTSKGTSAQCRCYARQSGRLAGRWGGTRTVIMARAGVPCTAG